MRRILRSAIIAIGAGLLAQQANAQALGPQRQFLAIEPYYERSSYDIGSGSDRLHFNGYGGRLWINTDPFHFIPNGSIALSLSYAPKQNINVNGVTVSSGSTQLAYGLAYDQFLVRRPLGGAIDPFLSVGYERYRVKESATGDKESFNALPVGGGIRIPLPNRFELRGDVKDRILFNTPTGPGDSDRTTHNLLLQAGLGLTF